MNRFKGGRFEIKEEPKASDARVVKVEEKKPSVVQTFEIPRLTKPGSGAEGYAAIKQKYGPLASTDAERPERAQRDRRFSLNQLVRGPLSVEAEERRVIEERVRAQIVTIEADERKKGFQAGYQDGLKQGRAEAFAVFKEEAQERLKRLDAFLGEMESLKDDLYKANERFLLEMVFRIARSVVLRELRTDQEYVLRLARELIERTGARENIRLYVHPSEKDSLSMLREGLEKELGTFRNLSVEASNHVKPGGCRVETEWNTIDAEIDQQLEGLHKALVSGIGESAAAEPRGDEQ